VPSSSVHIRCRAAAGRPESLTLTLSLTLNLLNLTLSLKLTSVLTHRPSYAKWRHSSHMTNQLPNFRCSTPNAYRAAVHAAISLSLYNTRTAVDPKYVQLLGDKAAIEKISRFINFKQAQNDSSSNYSWVLWRNEQVLEWNCRRVWQLCSARTLCRNTMPTEFYYCR